MNKKNTKKTMNKAPKETEAKYSFLQLFQSNRFKRKYQIDLAKVILGNQLYTVKEAEEILNKHFKSK